MKKLFISLAVVVLAVTSQGCATMSLPAVVASNAALPYQILAAGQVGSMYGQSLYGAPYGVGNIPVCRLQDLKGLPAVSQPVIVRVDKSKRHQTKDVVGGCIVGAGLGGLSGGGDGALYGCAAGGGGGLLVSNHEYDYCLYLPAPKP